MRWGCQRNNQRSPKILLFVISLLRLLPSGVPLCMGRSAGKSSVPFQSQIPCSPCPGLTALAGVSCGIGGQPVLEVGVVGADEDGGVFLVKIDFGVFSCWVSPVLIGLSFLRLCHAIGVFFGDFLRPLTLEKWRFLNRSAPDDVCPVRRAPIR